jgi:hypothetical protein
MSNTTIQLDFKRIGETIDVVLTEIYGHYVAKGSPTKLGGLRFLDVQSAKTFAFEKSQMAENGNLLVLSAPTDGSAEEIQTTLKSGPHADLMREVHIRKSPDAGKKNKNFVEVCYFLDTLSWLSDKNVEQVITAREFNGNEAVVAILKEKVLPIAEKTMSYFVESFRGDTEMPPVINPLKGNC